MYERSEYNLATKGYFSQIAQLTHLSQVNSVATYCRIAMGNSPELVLFQNSEGYFKTQKIIGVILNGDFIQSYIRYTIMVEISVRLSIMYKWKFLKDISSEQSELTH